MNTEIQEVEAILADIGRRCNPRLMEKKHTYARQMKSDAADKGMEFAACTGVRKEPNG